MYPTNPKQPHHTCSKPCSTAKNQEHARGKRQARGWCTSPNRIWDGQPDIRQEAVPTRYIITLTVRYLIRADQHTALHHHHHHSNHNTNTNNGPLKSNLDLPSPGSHPSPHRTSVPIHPTTPTPTFLHLPRRCHRPVPLQAALQAELLHNPNDPALLGRPCPRLQARPCRPRRQRRRWQWARTTRPSVRGGAGGV